MFQRIQALQHGEFLQRQTRPQTFDFFGLRLHASYGVYHPSAGSSTEFAVRSLSEHLPQPSPLRALDLGCGSGAITLWLKRQRPSWRVFGSDVDLSAVRDACDNARTNGLDVPFAVADLLDGLPQDGDWSAPWDAIIWNYPFWQVRPAGSQEAPYDHIGVDENGDLLRRFIPQIPGRLAEGGAVYLTYSSMSDLGLLRSLCAQNGLRACLIAEDGDTHYVRQYWKIEIAR